MTAPQKAFAVISFNLFYSAPSYFIEAIRPIQQADATSPKIEPDPPWWLSFETIEQVESGIQKTNEYLNKLASDSLDGHRAVRVMREIVKRESGWKWWLCNLTTIHGCKAGQGLAQVVPSTEIKTCEAHFERDMDMLNPYDNLDCAWWLLTDRGVRSGISHWDDMSWRYGLPRKWGSGPYNLKIFGY